MLYNLRKETLELQASRFSIDRALIEKKDPSQEVYSGLWNNYRSREIRMKLEQELKRTISDFLCTECKSPLYSGYRSNMLQYGTPS